MFVSRRSRTLPVEPRALMDVKVGLVQARQGCRAGTSTLAGACRGAHLDHRERYSTSRLGRDDDTRRPGQGVDAAGRQVLRAEMEVCDGELERDRLRASRRRVQAKPCGCGAAV